MIKNVKPQLDKSATHQKVPSTLYGKKAMRRKLIVLNVSGFTYDEKKEEVIYHLEQIFGKIPKGLQFGSRNTRPNKHNPDGLRFMIICDWFKRQRHYDYQGKFKLGTLIKAINKYILKETRLQLLKPDLKQEYKRYKKK